MVSPKELQFGVEDLAYPHVHLARQRSNPARDVPARPLSIQPHFFPGVEGMALAVLRPRWLGILSAANLTWSTKHSVLSCPHIDEYDHV